MQSSRGCRVRLAVVSVLATVSPLCAVQADAAPARSRHVLVDYKVPTSVRDVTYEDAEIQFSSYGSATARMVKSDRYVTVNVKDRTGLPVPFQVSLDQNGSGLGRTLGEFCGGASPRLRLQPGVAIIVLLEVGTCTGSPAAATLGTADFLFSTA